MRNVLTIAEKELRSYFVSPMAYVLTAAFLVISGYLFAMILLYTQQASLRAVQSNMSTLLLLLSPVLTMRLLAEEARSGTLELLLTSPLRDVEVVLGKFLASLGLLAAMLLCTGYYAIVVVLLGQPDLGPMASGYLGIFLLGAAFIAIGLLASSITQNQIVAAVIAFAVNLLLWLLSAAGDFASPPISDILRYASLDEHFGDFTRGMIDSRHVVYYVSVTAVALFAAVRALETRRWR